MNYRKAGEIGWGEGVGEIWKSGELFVQIMGCGVRDGTKWGIWGVGAAVPDPIRRRLDFRCRIPLYIPYRIERRGAERRDTEMSP